ncbi:hypothetical protein HDV05_001830, partial [Chytridiales sp. JEL 0842]
GFVYAVIGTAEASTLNKIFYVYVAGVPLVAIASYFAFSARQNHATSYELACQSFKKEAENYNVWEVDETKIPNRVENRFWHPSQVEIAARFLIYNSSPEALEVADELFLHGIRKYPKVASLLVSYAVFYVVYKNDSSMASNYLKKGKAENPTIDLEFTIYQQENEIRHIGAKTVGNKKLDAVDRVEFKQLMKKAKEFHKEAKMHIANFWHTIMMADSNVQTSVLIGLVAHMERSDKSATDVYKQLMTRFPLSVQVLSKYSQFVEEIHNNRDEADKVRRKIRRICDAGLSDDFNSQVSTQVTMPQRTRKEHKEYKEYKKQVYSFSRANSAQLQWMIRLVHFLLISVAVTQLLMMVIGITNIKLELDWMKVTNSCISTFDEVHRGMRAMQAQAMLNNSQAVNGLGLTLTSTISNLSDNST